MTDVLDAPENKALLKVMIAEHPDMPVYFLQNALKFYLADCISPALNKKKRGRKPKPRPIQEEIKGAVTILNTA